MSGANARIPVDDVVLDGALAVPHAPRGLVVFVHGSGSSRLSPRNQMVAATLVAGGFATLLFDLLTPREEAADRITAHLRFDVDLLAHRLSAVTDWVTRHAAVGGLSLGYFGASTGAAAALIAAAARPETVRAVVSRGGRPDLAGDALPAVRAATLLIVGGNDVPVIELNRRALRRLGAAAELRIVAGASHLFEEPGALEQVATLARSWFEATLQDRRAA
jgi:putative phosphoribosyl transferase